MHAVVVKVSISDAESAHKELKERVVPAVSGAPGFVAGYWTRSDDRSNGQSVIVFETQEAAQAAADRIGAHLPEGVTLEGTEVREVVANA
jgi:heme-degrading monooxygenase HmoA